MPPHNARPKAVPLTYAERLGVPWSRREIFALRERPTDLERLKCGMPEYHIYTMVADEKSYLGSCRIIQSADDNEAIRAAKRFLDFHELQIWDQSRLVARLYPGDQQDSRRGEICFPNSGINGASAGRYEGPTAEPVYRSISDSW